MHGWTPFLATWQSEATRYFRALCLRGPSARPTSDSASFLLPTLTTETANLLSLSMQKWPSHRVFAPTLLKSDSTRGYFEKAQELRGTRGRGPRMGELFRGALSPTWCEQYMGFPLGWTELEPSETPSSPNAPKSSDGS